MEWQSNETKYTRKVERERGKRKYNNMYRESGMKKVIQNLLIIRIS